MASSSFFNFGQSMHYPKQTKFRKYQKGFASGCKPEGSKLSFGRFGIKSLEATRVSSQIIEATRRTISRKLKRSGQIWVRVFADIPVSQKPAEVRMGKGKGQPSFWIARVQTGQLLFEMDGVSLQNAQQAAILASHKLGFRTKFVQWVEPLQIKKQ